MRPGGRWNNPLVNRIRFRHNVSITIAGFVAFLGAIPLATAGFGTHDETTPRWAYPLLLILIVPLVVAIWGTRAGTEADRDGLRVRALLGSRRIGWAQVGAFVPRGRRVVAVLTDGRSLVLPAVTPADLPRLVTASGERPTADEPTDEPDTDQ